MPRSLRLHFALLVAASSASSLPELWTNVGPSPVNNVVPLIADHASILTDDGTILTYGGLVHAFSDSLTYEAARISTTYVFDPASSTTVEIATSGEEPIVRAYHTLVRTGSNGASAWAFGGKCGSVTYCDDLWELDLGSLAWRHVVSPLGETGPAARYAHASAWQGERLWVSGGTTAEGPVADLWSFDPATSTWEELLPASGAASPPKRTAHVLVNSGGDELCVFGGKSPEGVWLADVWCVDPATRVWRELGTATGPSPRGYHAAVGLANGDVISHGGGTSDEYYDDMWVLRLGSSAAPAWERLAGNPPGSASPSPRWCHTAVLSRNESVLYVHGASGNGGYSNDFWRYDLGAACDAEACASFECRYSSCVCPSGYEAYTAAGGSACYEACAAAEYFDPADGACVPCPNTTFVPDVGPADACLASVVHKTTHDDTTVIVAAVLGGILGLGVVLLAALWARRQYRHYRTMKAEHLRRKHEVVGAALGALEKVDYPFNTVRASDFVALGSLMSHEKLRDQGKLLVLDTLEDLKACPQRLVFISHQWQSFSPRGTRRTSFSAPDHTGKQYAVMCAALAKIAAARGWALDNVIVWVDFVSIPQKHPGIQDLAIHSLACYASCAEAFVVVAPTCEHREVPGLICDFVSYKRRMWCRAEQLCHLLRNGCGHMFLATSETDVTPMEPDAFVDALRVFDGELTCCRLGHKGMASCDRQSLVIPILGLYAELYAQREQCKTAGASKGGKDGPRGASKKSSSADAFLAAIEENQDQIFPRSFKLRTVTRAGEESSRTVELFGDLVEFLASSLRGAGAAAHAGCAVEAEGGLAGPSKFENVQMMRKRRSSEADYTTIVHGITESNLMRHGSSKRGVSLEVI